MALASWRQPKRLKEQHLARDITLQYLNAASNLLKDTLGSHHHQTTTSGFVVMLTRGRYVQNPQLGTHRTDHFKWDVIDLDVARQGIRRRRCRILYHWHTHGHRGS